MHEFSIALNIVKLTEENAKKANANKILAIDIEVGKFSGVVNDALRFAMESATKETMLEHAQINLIDKEAWAICEECHHKFSIENFADVCPECHSVRYTITQGKELRVKSIEIE
ncbi:MAG: hydrogenase maturation nickel metallochaperone HypA [Bacteroidales bacterium]|nr:hydrogenase maturation nickel metallochaperone HypA [Bacteroidales bacterium]